MALGSKTSTKFYVTSGGGGNEINSTRKTDLEAIATAEASEGSKNLINDPTLGPLVLNAQRIQDDLDELRRFVASTDELQKIIGNGVVFTGSVYYIPITATDFQGHHDTRSGGNGWGMDTNGAWETPGRGPGYVERIIPIGFKATGCIVYGEADGSGDNEYRGYEGAINANTNTAQGTDTTVNAASDFTTQSGADIVGDGLKTCRVKLIINEPRDTFFGGKIILEKV